MPEVFQLRSEVCLVDEKLVDCFVHTAHTKRAQIIWEVGVEYQLEQ